MNIFDLVNSLPEVSIAKRLGLVVANDRKSYICPECGNGSGSTGDGIKQSTLNGRLVWHCYRCGGHWSNVDLIALVKGKSLTDTTELVKTLEEAYPEYVQGNLFSSRETKFTQQEKSAEVTSTSELKNYGRAFYPRYKETAKKFLEKHGGSYRGLTAETFEKYGIVVHPAFGVGEEEKVETLIIPYDDYHFVARAIESKRRPTQHGKGAGLYEPQEIDGKLPTFIVEGEIDALSVVQAVGSAGIRCIATGGASKYGKVVPELEKRFGEKENKPSFLVMFDNDSAGQTNGEKLVKELREAGYAADIFFLSEHMASEGYPKVDANDLLQRDGKELARSLLEGIEKNQKKLETQKAELAKKKRTENKIGIEISSFTEYFEGEFFQDIEQTAKYSERKTGFANIDAEQVFMPGLYVIGALPGSGKTTFAWQLLNQLAETGEQCIYCSFEMSRAELYTKSIVRELYKKNRELSERLKLTSVNIRCGAMIGSKELQDQAALFAKSAINLRVAELSNTNVTELIEGLKLLISAADKPPIICLDYLQIIPSKASSTKEKIDEVMLRLKDFQRATQVTLLVISSLNRENYWQPVSFSSFKESGAIEYSSDVIWGLENYGVDAEGKADRGAMVKMSRSKVREIKFSCLKNRNGGVYETFFRYHAMYDYFEELEAEDKSEGKRYEH
ncbi:MAG: toprim domain-containing protein [Treponema sp.]|nr:toprim domain-containing protein [Treponema sp.]